jgi:hypothetical protein
LLGVILIAATLTGMLVSYLYGYAAAQEKLAMESAALNYGILMALRDGNLPGVEQELENAIDLALVGAVYWPMPYGDVMNRAFGYGRVSTPSGFLEAVSYRLNHPSKLNAPHLKARVRDAAEQLAR